LENPRRKFSGDFLVRKSVIFRIRGLVREFTPRLFEQEKAVPPFLTGQPFQTQSIHERISPRRMKIWNPEVLLLDGSQVELADSFLFSYQDTRVTKEKRS
jgi:hypothetical protein